MLGGRFDCPGPFLVLASAALPRKDSRSSSLRDYIFGVDVLTTYRALSLPNSSMSQCSSFSGLMYPRCSQVYMTPSVGQVATIARTAGGHGAWVAGSMVAFIFLYAGVGVNCEVSSCPACLLGLVRLDLLEVARCIYINDINHYKRITQGRKIV